MLVLSELLLRHHELGSFDELLHLIKKQARAGEVFLQFDVRPPFKDTPQNWEDALEMAFTSAENTQRT